MKFTFLLLLALLALALAAIKSPYDGYSVQQIHISQGKNPSSMTVSWVTTEFAGTELRIGKAADKLDRVLTGTSTSYKYNYPNTDPYASGTIHHVVIDGLEADSLYFYQIGDFTADSTSGILNFRTQPAVGSKRPYTFAVVGDLGQTTDSSSTVNHILQKPYLGMILHAGDLSYADCRPELWDSYGILIEDLAKARPWMVTPGNHEIEFNPNDNSYFLAFEERYKMPQIRPAELGNVTIPPATNQEGMPYCASSTFQMEYNYGNSFYSFDVASSHVIFVNPYSVSDENSVQYKWVESDLKSVDRKITPWVIIVMHCPWYNSNSAHQAEKQAELMKASMEPLFKKHKVNIVIAGHVHAYERSYPVYQNNVEDDGIVYITIGDGGNYEGHASTYLEQPAWSAYRNGTQYGHAELTLVNEEKMMWKWYRNVDGALISNDEVVICNTAITDSAFC